MEIFKGSVSHYLGYLTNTVVTPITFIVVQPITTLWSSFNIYCGEAITRLWFCYYKSCGEEDFESSLPLFTF